MTPHRTAVDRIRRYAPTGVTALIVGGVAAGAGLAFVPAARALQWGLLAVACVLALAGIARLKVRPTRWPDPPQPPVAVGWQGLRSAQERMRREVAGRQRWRRRGNAG